MTILDRINSVKDEAFSAYMETDEYRREQAAVMMCLVSTIVVVHRRIRILLVWNGFLTAAILFLLLFRR